jgi:tetratricopeptide (TPR) repeat protein
MNAVVSGQLGIAFTFSGNAISRIDVKESDLDHVSSWAQYAWIASGASDLKRFRNIERESIVTHLRTEWSSDRCIQLVILILDRIQKHSIAESAANAANDLLSEGDVRRNVANRFFATPVPDKELLASAWQYAEQKPHLEDFLQELEEGQDCIAAISESWNSVPIDFFATARDKIELREWLIDQGSFRTFALARSDRRAFDKERFRCLMQLRGIASVQQIFAAWLDPLVPTGNSHTNSPENEDYLEEKSARASTLTGFEVFTSVQEQKQAIVPLLKSGERRKAMMFAQDLMDFQLKHGDPEHASKSLCDLAQRAKESYRHDIQCEFCQWAVEICPTDGWAYGQLADSYVCLGRFDEAVAAFENCVQLGEGAFGSTGIARVYQRRGELLEALDLFSKAQQDFPDESSAWLGKAEVLRTLHRWDESLNTYYEAEAQFPNEQVAYCGIAAVLTDVGRFADARSKYQECLSIFGDDAVALGGIADTYAKEGHLDKAIEAYDDAITRFPDEAIPLAGRADVFRLKGEYAKAMQDIRVGLERFEGNPGFLTSLAEVYRAQGDLPQALATYDEAMNLFAFEPRNWVGKANILKLQSNFEESLQWYDIAVQRFPYNVVAQSGRADILKQFGRFDDAIDAYESLKSLTRSTVSANHAIAAILGAQGQYDKALSLLGELPNSAQTKDDWIATHVYGMITLRMGDIPKATEVFAQGNSNCPWAREQRYFRNALALAQLLMKDYEAALQLVEEVESPFERLLAFHAYGSLGNLSMARQLSDNLELNCPPVLRPLRSNLAAFHLDQIISERISQRIETELCVGGLVVAA